jgi:hypothetical protein
VRLGCTLSIPFLDFEAFDEAPNMPISESFRVLVMGPFTPPNMYGIESVMTPNHIHLNFL